MKRELKAFLGSALLETYLRIARLIPMKRELKELAPDFVHVFYTYRKAHPDEKGTERH